MRKILRRVVMFTNRGIADGRCEFVLLLRCNHEKIVTRKWAEDEPPPVVRCLVCEREARKAEVLREHAPMLLAAAKEVVARWESGDLAEAVRNLADAIGAAEGRLAS